MMRSSELPSASSGVNPNMRSAAGFHRVIAPLALEMTTASPITSTSCSKSIGDVVCMALFIVEMALVFLAAIQAAPWVHQGNPRRGSFALISRLNGLFLMQVRDLRAAVTQALEHFVGMFAQ